MGFELGNLEFFLLILVRISGFIFSAPFYSLSNVPKKVRIGLSFFIAVILYGSLKQQDLEL